MSLHIQEKDCIKNWSIQTMAHGLDSYLCEVHPLSSDARTLIKTSESEGSLSQHLESLIGHHDCNDTAASDEGPATNSYCYSNHCIGNLSADSTSLQYYKETSFQTDGEQVEKDDLPTGNGDITDGSQSLPSSFATDLQGLEQDCGLVATSFFEDFSDVSSCSDADVGETRTSCKFMASNSVPKPKTVDGTKHCSSESRNMCQINSLCPNISETNVSPSNVKAEEAIVECSHGKLENHEKTVKAHNQSIAPSNSVTVTGSETEEDRNYRDGCQDHKQKAHVERNLIQGKHSGISKSGHENSTCLGVVGRQDGNENKLITTNAPFNNEQYHIEEGILGKEMNESSNRENDRAENVNSTFDQNEIKRRDMLDKSKVLKWETQTSGSKKTSDEQSTLMPDSTDSQDEKMETEYKEKEIKSDPSGNKVPDSKDASHGVNESISKHNSLDGESCLHKSHESHLTKACEKKERRAEFCLQSNSSSTDINPCVQKDWTDTTEKTNTTSSSDPNWSGSGVTSDSFGTSHNKDQSVADHPDFSLQSDISTININPCPERQMRPSEKSTPTLSTDSNSSSPDVTSVRPSVDISDNKQQNGSIQVESSLQTNGSTTNMHPNPAETTNTSSPDQQHPLNKTPSDSIEPQSLCGEAAENARESFEELDTSLGGLLVSDMLYGEPLSREDSSCDTDETRLGTSKSKKKSLAKTDRNRVDHSEGQITRLQSSRAMRNLQPVVVLRTLEPVNGTSTSYHCGHCQHTTCNVDSLIKHHHCHHSVHNFQFCKTCNIYLMRTEHAEHHLCYMIKGRPQLSSNSSVKVKRKRRSYHNCIKCRLTFSKLVQYIRHMRTHTGKTPFLCNECGLYFAQAGTLQRHKRIPGRCRNAKRRAWNSDAATSGKKTSPQKDSVQNKLCATLPECHVRLVDISKNNLCNVCGKFFSTAEKAKEHFYNFHKGNSLAISSSQCTTKGSGEYTQKLDEMREKYKCPLCPRLFKYSYNRARHLRDCVKDAICGGKEKVCGKYRCPLCHVSFTLPSNRYRHIKAICLEECLHRLAKERANLRQKDEQNITKENEEKTELKEKEQKTPSKENEQNKKETPAIRTPTTFPRYKCNLCPAVFCHASGKYRHMKKHELFKLTGKMFRYRNSAFSISKPATLSSSKTEESKDNLKSTISNSRLALSCKFCGKYFSTTQSLKKHEHNHRGERPYRCLECGKGFKRRAHLIGHKTVHQKRIQCTVCRKILPTIGELIQHRSSHLKRGKLQCPDCDLQFQYPVYLLRHLSSHKNRENKAPQSEEREPLKPSTSLESVREQSEPQQLQCSLCKEVFDSAQVLRKHCLTHISGTSSNQCPFCQNIFNSRRYLLSHMIKHTGNKPFSCTNCGKQFYRGLYLKLHSERCLPSQKSQYVTTESNTKAKRPYLCSYCPRTFSKKNRLKSHHRGHNTNSLLLCSRCGQYFGFRKLNQHQRNCGGAARINTDSTNGDIRKNPFQSNQTAHKTPLQSNASKLLPFKCSYCTQRFRYRSILFRHLVSHTGLQPYACMHCGHRYGSQTMCLQHEAFCDGVYKEGPSKAKTATDAANPLSMPTLREVAEKQDVDEYKCKFCTKTFLKSRSLRRHILTHNEVKPYRCKACDNCFSRYDHLKIHQTRCKGKRARLEVRIPKISLDDVGKGWQNRFGIEPAQKEETFECKVCLRRFSTQSKLSRHVTMFHVAKLFKCTRCGSSFAHEKSLKKHRRMNKCRKVFSETNATLSLDTDPPTENVTNQFNVVRNRILQKIKPCFNKKYNFVCSYCPRTFGNNWQLSVHTRLHTGEKPFACEYCGQRFIRKDYVQRHFAKCTEKKTKMLCDRCGGFFSKAKLEHHKKSCTSPSASSTSTDCQSKQSTSQSPPKGFSCAYCSSRFLLFSQLQEHFLNAHKLETVVPPVSTAPLQHHLSRILNIKEEPVDEICDKQLGDGANLTCKLDAALDGDVPKQFFCTECNLSFASKAGLAGHLRVHSLEHPFSCKTCNKGFWNKSLLRNHYRKCRFGRVAGSTTQQFEAPLKAELDFALNDSVLVFKEGSTSTGTGVLQTNFSCKEDLEESSKYSESNEAQSNKEKKPVTYQCSECDKSFTDGLLLISHLEDHGREEQEKKRNTCIKCGRVFVNQEHLEKHMKTHRSDQKYPCPDCSKIADTISELEIHRACHDPNRPYFCKLCNQRFWTRPSLCNHYGTDHPEDAFTCRFCNKAYSVKKSLARHYRKWHQNEQKDLVSSLQEKSCAEQSSCHVSTTGDSDEDENNGTEDSDSDSAPYFPCHVCGKTFPTSESLEDHQRCHLGEKPHECEECGRCFFQASQLQQHQRMHKSEFQCQACGRGFVSLFALRKHKHTHGKSRPYRCSKCHFSFTGPLQLAEHMRTHREENFPCDICNRIFLSKSSRAEHWKSHSKSGNHPPLSGADHEKSPPLSESSSVFTKELKYRCGVCNERFRDPEELSEHGCMATKERPYSCSDCNKHFLHASHLKKHKTTHRQSWSSCEYPCNRCDRRFSSPQQFLSHLKTHVDTAAIELNNDSKDGDSHRIACPVCHQYFAGATELISHLPTHSDSTFECKSSGVTFPSAGELEEDEHCHPTSTTEFECTKCDQHFVGSDAFCIHPSSHKLHTITESKSSDPSVKAPPPTRYRAAREEEQIDVTEEEMYNCPYCSLLFSSKSSLLEHQNKHSKPFKCELCGKAFALRRYLRKHERRHRLKFASHRTAQFPEMKLKCSQCHIKFNTPEDLSLHKRLHAEKEGGQYRCDMCYKSFSHRVLLKRHQESHVGEVVYECTECDKAFAFPHLLEEHQQTHAGSSR